MLKTAILYVKVNVDVVAFAISYFCEIARCFFFQPNVTCRSASDEKPLPPVMWRIFNRNISKNNNSFDIEIAKSIPHIGIVTNYAKTC